MSCQAILSFFVGRRGERGLPAFAKYLPVILLHIVARRRRSQGFYDGRTMALFRAVWQRRQSTSVLLERALYRRDLGRPLPRRWSTLLFEGLANLGAGNRRLALALLAESFPQSMASVPVSYLSNDAKNMAPLAFFCEQLDGELSSSWIARLHERQQSWREDFSALLRQHAVDGICLVGNSGRLIGADLGSIIDGYGLVVRFNLFSGENSKVSDLGSRMDVWVGSPGFDGEMPPEVDWVVSTGPDMRFRRQSWTPFEERLIRGLPVLTVPLSIWRELVVECCAPPSAGILLVAWLKDLLGSWQGVFTVGIGIPSPESIPYHHVAPKHLPSDRHNWEKEISLLSRWRSEGLQSHEFSRDNGGKG